jgi:signal transduction histidine kinase
MATSPGAVIPASEAVLEALPEAALLVREWRVVWANLAAKELLARGDPTGCSLSEFFTEEDRGRIDERLAQPRGDRLRTHLRLVDQGAPMTTELRVCRIPHEPSVVLVMVRPVSRPATIERTFAELAHTTKSMDAAALFAPEKLAETVEPVFAGLGWTATLWEVRSSGAMPVRTLGSTHGELSRRLRMFGAELIPFEQIPVLADVASTGRGRFVDDVPEVVASVFARRGASPHEVSQLRDAMWDRGDTRGVWAPIYHAGRVNYVLTVVARDLDEGDFAAILLLAHHFSAALRMADLAAWIASEERTTAVEAMSSVIAEQMGEPLSAVQEGTAGLSEQLTDPETQPSLDLFIDTVHSQTARLQGLVDHLASFGTQLPVRPEPVELDTALGRAVAAARAATPDGGGERVIVRHFPRGRPVVFADPALLGHALTHLLLNVFEHPPSWAIVRISAHEEGGLLQLHVCNEGPPVSQEVLQQAFTPFFTTKPGHAGLGLTIVRRVARSLGGDAWIEGTAQDTTVSMSLPTLEGESQ